ncbi:MAG TPA: DUF6797 domain-containing protein, partial [Verrucomicrobiae bacterium]
AGEQKLRTPAAPGWADASGSFKDPRKEPFGPVPAGNARWNGLYVVGDQVVLHYTVLGTKVWEFPASAVSDELVGFARNFQIESPARDLAMLVCEVDHAEGAVKDGVVTVKEGTCCATIAGLVGAPSGVTLEVQDKNRIVLKIAKGTPASLFRVVVWKGDQGYTERAGNLLKSKPEMPDFKKGGPAHWPQPVITVGALDMSSTPDGAYVTDKILVPEQNPWNRRVRLSGLDFFSDGTRAALCTWDGDVWIVSGIDDKLEKLTWKRFASGLYEPLGLKIGNDTIYVSGRDGITRLHDLNGDGEADFYENFNNEVTSSTGFHEFVFDLQTDREGNFYFAKAGPVRYGGRGFGTFPEEMIAGPIYGTVTEHAGTLMRVSKDGGKLEVVARGFRAPNGIGIGPGGELTSGDNEGTWVPVCPLNWIKPGSGTTFLLPDAHLRTNPNPKKPLLWFPLKWDNSGGSQVWVPGDKFGPLKGELLHASYGTCALYHIMKQPVGDLMQGAAVRLPLKLTSSAMRTVFNPRDGQLYVVGLRGWQTTAARDAGFDRVRYTGKPVHSVHDFKVDKAGVHLTFTQPLDAAYAKDPQNFSAEAWNYMEKFGNDRLANGHIVRDARPVDNYGSHEVSVSDPGRLGRDKLDVKSSKLSDDGKTLTLEIAGLKPVDNLLIRYLLKAKDGAPVEQEVLATIHVIP